MHRESREVISGLRSQLGARDSSVADVSDNGIIHWRIVCDDWKVQRKIDGKWLNATANVLVGVVASVMNAEPRSFRKLLANAVVAKVGAAGASYGAFGLASLIGTASTGTAIGTLSGAASHSATLAWLGFGSMVTGGTLIVPAAMVAGGYVLLKVWKGKARQPESLSANEREIVSACTGMGVELRRQADSDQLPSRAVMTFVVWEALLPIAQRLAEYKEAEDFSALRIRSRLRLRHLARRLDGRIESARIWCDE